MSVLDRSNVCSVSEHSFYPRSCSVIVLRLNRASDMLISRLTNDQDGIRAVDACLGPGKCSSGDALVAGSGRGTLAAKGGTRDFDRWVPRSEGRRGRRPHFLRRGVAATSWLRAESPSVKFQRVVGLLGSPISSIGKLESRKVKASQSRKPEVENDPLATATRNRRPTIVEGTSSVSSISRG